MLAETIAAYQIRCSMLQGVDWTLESAKGTMSWDLYGS
jgi:hypothetical protein